MYSALMTSVAGEKDEYNNEKSAKEALPRRYIKILVCVSHTTFWNLLLK